MELQQAIQLIKSAVITATEPAVWADLGCGTGLFTQALARLLAPGSTIYAIDQDAQALQQLPEQKTVTIKKITANFLHDPLPVDKINGFLMANSLHYVKDQVAFIKKMQRHLLPGSGFLLVEYNTSQANRWVPYPVSFRRLQQLAEELAFPSPQQLAELPSHYQGTMYAAWLAL